MIILDTNVISEAMRGPEADAGVIAWLRYLPQVPVTTVINRAEVLAGIELLPKGDRREQLSRGARRAFAQLGACLPLTPECAESYAAIVASRCASGHPIGGMDALIAAIAVESRSTIATRDIDDFRGIGVDVINPWEVSHDHP